MMLPVESILACWLVIACAWPVHHCLNTTDSPPKRTIPTETRTETGSSFYTLTSRTSRYYNPIVHRPAFVSDRSLVATRLVPMDTIPGRRIVVPVGESFYRPIQYIDVSVPTHHHSVDMSRVDAFIDKHKSKKAVHHDDHNQTHSPPANEFTEQKTSESVVDVVNVNSNGHKNKQDHKPRTIELDSATYAPLTFQFPPRPSKFNVLPGDGSREYGFNNANKVAKDKPNVRQVDIDAQTLFGKDTVQEPIVLKPDGKNNIPDDMQRIIKCIFPDFKFAGDDRVASAC